MMRITKKEFCARMDHSLLGWTVSEAEVRQCCSEALEYGFASVCVNPDRVKLCSEILGSRCGVSCVVGFPCGANTTAIKIAEALDAIDNGATEIDFVSNYGFVMDGKYDALTKEYQAVVSAIKAKKAEVQVKIIIYAPYGKNPFLTDAQLKNVVESVMVSGADYIKYCYDPRQIIPLVKGRMKMKFSGAVNFEVTCDALQLGCDRIGEDDAAKWLKTVPDDFWLPED